MHGPATVTRCAILILAVVFLQACGGSVTPRPGKPEPIPERSTEGRIQILHHYLAKRIRNLEMRSPRLHAAMDSVRSGSADVFIGTPELLAAAAPLLGSQMAPPRVGEFTAITDNASGSVQTLVVRVNLHRLAEISSVRTVNVLSWFSHRRKRAALDRLVDAVLIHELWGHLIPVALAGNISARCADPRPGEPELDSCVMRRENELRLEMGMPPRPHYSVDAR